MGKRCDSFCQRMGSGSDGARACKRVLVVDDDQDVQEAIAEVLADQEYRALVASNGQEALVQLRAMGEKPCVILLDLTMPVMDGFQFLGAQRADPALRRIPVIVVTAHFEAADVADLGFAALVRKPFTPHSLLDTVNTACCGNGASWFRVADDPERWERTGFGAVEAREPRLWAALPVCGHDYYSAFSVGEARQQLDQREGLCFVCWHHIDAFLRGLRRSQSTPPGGSPLE